jgi:4-hydroxy-tetrahydrodipicolinate reductase
MRIVISGYGKMGKEIEKVAIERGHTISATIDTDKDWESEQSAIMNSDVVIDFSQPDTAVQNIKKCFDFNIPVVIGTTGWYDELEKIENICLVKNQSLFVASNFSIGVNILFEMNKRLATIMNSHPEYDVMIEETHHVHKKDAPSGTAITLGNQIINNLARKSDISGAFIENPHDLMIKSFRIDEVPGTHIVNYSSEIDELELRHVAKSRRGFAVGAIMAAEWIIGKKGFFEMSDMLGFE